MPFRTAYGTHSVAYTSIALSEYYLPIFTSEYVVIAGPETYRVFMGEAKMLCDVVIKESANRETDELKKTNKSPCLD